MVGTRATDAPAARRSATRRLSSAMVGTTRVPAATSVTRHLPAAGRYPAPSIVPAPSRSGPVSCRASAFSTALRTSGASTAPGRATPMPSSRPLAWSTIAARERDRRVDRLAVGRAVGLGDHERLAAHLDDERLADGQHRRRSGDREPGAGQPGEVDARARERHRRVHRERDRARRAAPARARRCRSGRPCAARAGRAARRPPRRARRRARASSCSGTASSTSSLRSTISGIGQHGHDGEHGGGALTARRPTRRRSR